MIEIETGAIGFGQERQEHYYPNDAQRNLDLPLDKTIREPGRICSRPIE